MSGRNAKAVEVANIEECKAPGAFCFTGLHGYEGTYGIVFCCPCGCGDWGALSFDNRPAEWVAKDRKRPTWHWDGNRERPTLTPSIQKTTDCRWHGFLRNGVFEEC